MKKSQEALSILGKIRDLLESEPYGMDNPEALKQLKGLIQILKMHTSGFLPDSTFKSYLREQIGKIDEYRNDLYSGQSPKYWRTHEECKAEIAKCYIIAEGLIERHARECEENAE
jgi:hypothetical protein